MVIQGGMKRLQGHKKRLHFNGHEVTFSVVKRLHFNVYKVTRNKFNIFAY